MKFWTLLQKEIRELLNPQALIPLVITVVMFVVLGKIAGSEIQRSMQPEPATVIDHDDSTLSALVIDALKEMKFEVTLFADGDPQSILAQTDRPKLVVEIPANFSEGLLAGHPKELQTFIVFTNFSFMGSRTSDAVDQALAKVNQTISAQLLAQAIPGANPTDLTVPIRPVSHVVVSDKQATIQPSTLMGFVNQQTTFIPIILFVVILTAAQMIAMSIATEKENKTLETLLSAPVSRRAIVAAKMLAAGFVALLSALVYMFSLRYYFSSLTGLGTQQTNESASDAIQQLGLQLDWQGYLLVGATLFLAILCALAIALILGVFSEDSKSVQGVISPLMILILIPYFLTLFVDFSVVSPLLKWLVYAIPFAYPFLAAPSIFLENYQFLFWGMAYQALFFVIAVYIAAWIFSTDRVVTMRINLSRRRKPEGA